MVCPISEQMALMAPRTVLIRGVSRFRTNGPDGPTLGSRWLAGLSTLEILESPEFLLLSAFY